jgi:hypothetical protein
MLKKIIAAAFAGGLVASASASAQPIESLGGYRLDEIKAAIVKSGDIAMVSEKTEGANAFLVVKYQDFTSGLYLQCPPETGSKCVTASFKTGYPTQISADVNVVNEMNKGSLFGWLVALEDGKVGFAHGLVMTGLSLDGLLQNIRLNTAIYVLRAQELAQAPKSVSLPGVIEDPKESIVDAAHQPQANIGVAETFPEILSDADLAANLAGILSDAQTKGELRKIANDLLGD